MHIQNFKCFKDFDIELGPFNVLVGPNDSGKTAFLQAIRLVAALRNTAKPHPLKEFPLEHLDELGDCTSWPWQRVDNRVVIDAKAFASDAQEDVRTRQLKMKSDMYSCQERKFPTAGESTAWSKD